MDEALAIKPLWLKVQDGDPLTLRERALIWTAPIRRAWHRRGESAALRERCVDYAIRGGATGWSVTQDAERIMAFISRGER